VNYAKSTTNPDGSISTGQTINLADSPTAVGATGLYYTVTNTDMTSLVNALATRTGFNILSSPKVIALNNQKAEIITGSRLGYKIKTVTTTGMIESVEFLDVGTKLVMTPSIKSDGQIVMEIHPEISEGSIINDLPQKNSTETTTKLIVKDGQTIVIGGLIRDTSKKEVKGVPILMDIPLIGMAFKSTNLTSEKKEVVVLITPHIYNAKLESEMDKKSSEILSDKKDLSPVMPLDLAR
jgi:type II secretory pathway component GspD/PulD (secretin)